MKKFKLTKDQFIEGQVITKGSILVITKKTKSIKEGRTMTIDIDVNDENSKIFVDLLYKATEKYGLSVKIDTMRGPGGGMPQVYLTGDVDKLRDFYVNVYQEGYGDPSEFDELYL